MTALALVLGLCSLALFLGSVVVHVAAFVPGSGVSVRLVALPLHLGVMAVGFAAMGHFAALRRRSGLDQKGFQKLTERMTPQWAGRGVLVLFVYTALNFTYFVVAHEGAARLHDGKFALTDHGRLIREVTEEEFRAAERFEVRGMSAHWMLFAAIETFYFLYLYPRTRAAVAAGAGG